MVYLKLMQTILDKKVATECTFIHTPHNNTQELVNL